MVSVEFKGKTYAEALLNASRWLNKKELLVYVRDIVTKDTLSEYTVVIYYRES